MGRFRINQMWPLSGQLPGGICSRRYDPGRVGDERVSIYRQELS